MTIVATSRMFGVAVVSAVVGVGVSVGGCGCDCGGVGVGVFPLGRFVFFLIWGCSCF